MFLRFNRLNRCLNALSVQSITTSAHCRRCDTTSHHFQQTIAHLNQDLKPSSQSTDRPFLSDRLFRTEVLQSVFTLSQNVVKGNRSVDELIESQDLQQLCQTIEENVNYLRNRELINSLHSFLLMGTDPNTSLIQNLENEVLWRAKYMTLKDLLQCLSYHVRYQTTEQQMK
ncbi:unnamed protein product, partial [Oppiella nova]